MSVYLQDGMVLLNSGSVAVETSCCCGGVGGACCLPEGPCVIETSAECLADDGIYLGDGTSCIGVECSGGGSNIGCCVCPGPTADCPSFRCCSTTVDIECLEPCQFLGTNTHCCDFGDGKLACCGNAPLQQCCPGENTDAGCCPDFALYGYTCWGNFCCNPSINVCCDDGTEGQTHYVCDFGKTCCGGNCCDPDTEECCVFESGSFCCPIGSDCIC